ncbi:MAG: 50S ribosomal protein L30 [Bacteriovoracia bacterium]
METKKAKSGKTITVRLKKGLMGCTEIQRATVVGLGLKGRMAQRELENTPAVRGMIKKVIHLLDIVAEKR